jgi:hypothetical protein
MDELKFGHKRSAKPVKLMNVTVREVINMLQSIAAALYCQQLGLACKEK